MTVKSTFKLAPLAACIVALGLLGACDNNTGRNEDAGTTTGTDAGTTDAGTTGTDAGTTDAGTTGTDGGRPTSCVDLSQPNIECNPMAAGDCGAPGSSCDVAIGDDGFPAGTQCFEPPNDTPVGGACDNSNFCVPGSHCHVDTCRAFCCSTADCAAGFTCNLVQFGTAPGAETQGICLE